MDIKELIRNAENISNENARRGRAASGAIEKYLLSQTMSAKALVDVVKKEYNPLGSSSGQISEWQILNLIKTTVCNIEAAEKTE